MVKAKKGPCGLTSTAPSGWISRGPGSASDTGFLLLREMDKRFCVIGPMSDCLEDRRSAVHTRHSLIQMIRQRVYQIAVGYEDCNDADHLRIDRFALPSARATRLGEPVHALAAGERGSWQRGRAQSSGRCASALDRRPSEKEGQAAADHRR